MFKKIVLRTKQCRKHYILDVSYTLYIIFILHAPCEILQYIISCMQENLRNLLTTLILILKIKEFEKNLNSYIQIMDFYAFIKFYTFENISIIKIV